MDETKSVGNPESTPSYSLAVIQQQNYTIRLAYDDSLGDDPENPFFSLMSSKEIFGEDAPLIWATKSKTIKYSHNGKIIEAEAIPFYRVDDFCSKNKPKYDPIQRAINDHRTKHLGLTVATKPPEPILSPPPASKNKIEDKDDVLKVYRDLTRFVDSRFAKQIEPYINEISTRLDEHDQRLEDLSSVGQDSRIGGMEAKVDDVCERVIDLEEQQHIVVDRVETVENQSIIKYSVKNYYNGFYKMKLTDEELEQEGRTLSEIHRDQGKDTGTTREYNKKQHKMIEVATYLEMFLEPRRKAFAAEHPGRYTIFGELK